MPRHLACLPLILFVCYFVPLTFKMHYFGLSRDDAWLVGALGMRKKGSGFEPEFRHFDFRNWYILLQHQHMTVLLLKIRKSSKQALIATNVSSLNGNIYNGIIFSLLNHAKIFHSIPDEHTHKVVRHFAKSHAQ